MLFNIYLMGMALAGLIWIAVCYNDGTFAVSDLSMLVLLSILSWLGVLFLGIAALGYFKHHVIFQRGDK